MKTSSPKKRNAKLQQQRQSETRLNQIRNTEQPLMSSSNTRVEFFTAEKELINIPQPKRAKKQKDNVLFEKPKEPEIKPVSKIVQGLEPEKNHKKSKSVTKTNKQISVKDKNEVSPGKIVSENQIQSKQGKKYHRRVKKDNIGQILAHFLGQDAFDKGNKLQQPMKTVYEWQNEEIKKFVADPNLGDYIIKLPNPDCPSKEFFKLFPQAEGDQENCFISYQKAYQFFSDMFGVQNASKKRIQKQTISFRIAFYLLNLDQNYRKRKQQLIESLKGSGISQQQVQSYMLMVQKQVQIFIRVLDYYIQISQLEFQQVVLKRKYFMNQLHDVLEIYRTMPKHQGTGRNSLDRQLSADLIEISTLLNMKVILTEYEKRQLKSEEDLNKHKKAVFEKFLEPYIEENANNLIKTNWGYGYQANISRARPFYSFFSIIKRLSKISLLFTYFTHKSAKQYMLFIQNEFQTDNSLRKAFKGNHLQKMMYGQNMLWVNNKERPKDLYTLLRNCLMYQLTQNCLFRARSFLSRNENYIMVVVKSSEEVLEYYAQKNELSMEIEIGATDIFSFQPVDQYNRPLRLNKYVRDEQFIAKYSLRSNKMDKDEQQQAKAVQSQALNIFKKAETMNVDELRAKIILDQEDADDMLRWVGKKINVRMVDEESNILTNDHNTAEVDRQTWQCYFVYNKLLISYLKRLKKSLETPSLSVHNQTLLKHLNNNLGFILRIMFIKAITMVNDFFYNNRESRSHIPNRIKNIFISKKKLKSLWDRMDVRQPTGYFQYVKNQSLQRIWRKYEINERRDRSKFFPAERLNISNRIINKYINIGRAIEKQHVSDYYPLHDPFILKGIRIEPYLINLRQKIPEKKGIIEAQSVQVHDMYAIYESRYTAQDFTKKSVQQKLAINNSLFRNFSTQTVRFYCGQKIAYYFQFMRYITKEAFPYMIPCFIIQIFFWAQQTQILKTGQTSIGYFNDALVFIMTLFNMFWTTNTVEHWKWQEKNLSEKFGVAQMTQKDEKRVTFVGAYKRNFETDQLNFQYVPKWITIIKSIFTTVINLLYLTFVCLIILEIFVLKSIMFQSGFPQSAVNTVPAILIALAVQVFNWLYVYLIKLITQFQNHKTISSFQQSLISKSYIITFVITFISIFIYAFFSAYLDSDYLCVIKATQTKETIYNCSYFVSSQLLSLVLVDLVFTIVVAIWPYLLFKIKQWRQAKRQKPKTKFYFNKFESIDEFYEEQDKMHSYMFNQEIDSTWLGYMNVINVFTAVALFGPALPLVYVMMFFNGVVRLHASKFEIILLAKRSIPVKTNSINWWLVIIEIVSVISIFTNIAYMVFTRHVFTGNQTQIFFFFVISFLILKFYLLMQYDNRLDVMGQRNKRRVTEMVLKKSFQRNDNYEQPINTDILNVFYDEVKLKRMVPKIKKANVRFKENNKLPVKTSS